MLVKPKLGPYPFEKGPEKSATGSESEERQNAAEKVSGKIVSNGTNGPFPFFGGEVCPRCEKGIGYKPEELPSVWFKGHKLGVKRLRAMHFYGFADRCYWGDGRIENSWEKRIKADG